jgi:hypothetical protein
VTGPERPADAGDPSGPAGAPPRTPAWHRPFHPFPDLIAFLRGRWGLLTAALAVGGAFLLPRVWAGAGPVVCPSRLVTGIPCPGCGLTRAFAALGHGDPAGAFRCHPFALLLFAGLVLLLVEAGWRRLGGTAPRPLSAAIGFLFSPALLGGWLVWGVVRAAGSLG